MNIKGICALRAHMVAKGYMHSNIEIFPNLMPFHSKWSFSGIFSKNPALKKLKKCHFCPPVMPNAFEKSLPMIYQKR